jgi:hypothetical protein
MSTTAVWVWNDDPPAANCKPLSPRTWTCIGALELARSKFERSRGRSPSEKDENII